jgi:ubiquitin carboxyl-terminal hydrolase 7
MVMSRPCLVIAALLSSFFKICCSRIGIANLGNTCYLNSVIQSLYHADEFRDKLECRVVGGGVFDVSSALVSIFNQLDGEEVTANAKVLVQLCKVNPFIQEDAQEFLLKLFEKIDDDSTASNEKNGSPTDVFAGEMVQYIRCCNVNFTKERKTSFYDLSVDVVGADDLPQALDNLFTPDLLEGDGQYKTAEHGLQDASKGQYISKLPSVLYIHLKRFSYDFTMDKMRKVK